MNPTELTMRVAYGNESHSAGMIIYCDEYALFSYSPENKEYAPSPL